MALRIAERVVKITDNLHIPYVFKGSYRKANRSRLDSFTGIGDEKALKILAKVRSTFDVPVVTDIHTASEAEMAAEYVDVLQIPAFLCRQTDLLVAAARTGKIVNIKKGQFLSPAAMRFAADKVVEAGNDQVMLTERGTTFGYQDLIVDYRGIPEMQSFGHPVVLDVTHSLQQPNQTSGVTGGMPQLIETVAKLTETSMMTPPMVGVPCFTKWLSGPSARTCWPIWLDLRNLIHAGISTMVTAMATTMATNTKNVGYDANMCNIAIQPILPPLSQGP